VRADNFVEEIRGCVVADQVRVTFAGVVIDAVGLVAVALTKEEFDWVGAALGFEEGLAEALGGELGSLDSPESFKGAFARRARLSRSQNSCCYRSAIVQRPCTRYSATPRARRPATPARAVAARRTSAEVFGSRWGLIR
jgi:hypothetical protein